MKHLELLGKKAKDKVTGFSGVVTTVSFDLYGCIQAVLTPSCDDGEMKIRDGHWFDITRLEVTSNNPVMDTPDFNAGYVAQGRKGPAEKPVK